MNEFEHKLKTAEALARSHRVSRRDFIQLAMATGLTLPAASALFSRQAAASPVKGGNFILGMEGGSASDSLDPRTYADSVMIAASLACMNGLIEFDNSGNPTGELIESWEAKPGAAEWILNVRKGVKFSNGKALDATIQALEVQKMTLATLENMNLSLKDVAESFRMKPEPEQPAKAPEPPVQPAAESGPTEQAAPAVDPMQWWNSLTEQFTGIASNALQDMAGQAAKAAEQMAQTVQAGAEAAEKMVEQAMEEAERRSAQAADEQPAASKPARKTRAAAKSAATQPLAKKAAAAKKAAPAKPRSKPAAG